MKVVGINLGTCLPIENHLTPRSKRVNATIINFNMVSRTFILILWSTYSNALIDITLFISITMFFETDIIPKYISNVFPWNIVSPTKDCYGYE